MTPLPEAKRRREASNLVNQEITGELQAFRAVIGARSSGRIGSRRKHRVLDYIQGLRSTTPRDERDHEAEAFKLRETMQPKLLVVPFECKTWSQLQNLSKDNQLFEVKRTHFSRHLEAVAQMYHGQVDDHNYFLHEHSQFPRNRQYKELSCIYKGETVFTGFATGHESDWVAEGHVSLVMMTSQSTRKKLQNLTML